MIERDRALLARLMQVNTSLGRLTVDALHEQNGGELCADRLRDLGHLAGGSSADLFALAAERDGRVVEHVIIDARPNPRKDQE